MPRTEVPPAVPVDTQNHTSLPPPTLSRECKHHLALLVANMIGTYLSSPLTFDAQHDAVQVRSSGDKFNLYPISIMEDSHADHRSPFHQDHRHAPAEDGVCLLASIEHGTGS